MKLRHKVIFAVLISLFVTILLAHWRLNDAEADLQQSFDDKTRLDVGDSSFRTNDAKMFHTNSGSFQELTDGTFIYSAFMDGTLIRLLLLSGKHYQPKILCHYCENISQCSCPSQSAVYYALNENHKRIYGGYIASCTIPECFNSRQFIHLSVEKSLKIHRISLITTSPYLNRYEYTVCVPPLRGEGTDFAYKLTEFIEMSLILGAKHIIFYEYQIDEMIKKILSIYKDKGVVSTIMWNLPSLVTSDVNNIWYHGQVISIQDCLYRSKAASKFVAFNDIDEFIVPLKHASVPALLQSLHMTKNNGLCFSSTIFSLNARYPGKRKSTKLRTLRFNRRTSLFTASRSKCIVDPQKVFEMGIHHLSKSADTNFNSRTVNTDIGLVFHYRTCTSELGIGRVCSDLVTDTTVQDFDRNLQQKVDKTMNYIQTIF